MTEYHSDTLGLTEWISDTDRTVHGHVAVHANKAKVCTNVFLYEGEPNISAGWWIQDQDFRTEVTSIMTIEQASQLVDALNQAIAKARTLSADVAELDCDRCTEECDRCEHGFCSRCCGCDGAAEAMWEGDR